MKNTKYLFQLLLLATIFLLNGCEESNLDFGDVIAPSEISIIADIIGADSSNPAGDGSGMVILTATGTDVISYNFQYGDGITEIRPSGIADHQYSIVGTNTYTIVVSAIGTAGLTTTTSIDIDVYSSFDDQEAKELLSGGSSKTWYWSASEMGHLGVGPSREGIDGDWWWPKWYEAAPFEKAGDPQSSCIYEDELTFSLEANNQLTYVLNNNGRTFFNGAHSGIGGGSGSGDDICLDFDTSGSSIVSLSPSTNNLPEDETRGTVMNFSPDNFMGYYVGSSSYEILEVTANTLYVRVVDASNSDLAWYHKFTTSPSGAPSDELDIIYTNLVWADEFDTDGAPNTANWGYDLGDGGWGNNESQYYTDRADNVKVENGSLIITAKAESFNGANYTSARLKTENLMEYTYGRIDVYAKLPEGGGTWPAIWMLGANFDTVGWPNCGEIDIMEHVGNNPGRVQAAMHTPSSSGGTVNLGGTDVSNVSSEFHLYSMNWSADQISFLVDDEIFYTYNPDVKDLSTWPFDTDQFLILNVAMGGSLGGTIDPAFTESTMEIDYVRVYQ